jgi:hypothetical protein
MSIQYIDTSKLKEIPSSLQQVEFKKDELEVYNNYVYTILDFKISATLTCEGGDWSNLKGLKDSNVKQMYHVISRSYAEEEDAKKWCDSINFSKEKISAFFFPESVEMTAWLHETFGSSSASFIVDPVTQETRVIIKKALYFKNELHGSVLETEQTWH